MPRSFSGIEGPPPPPSTGWPSDYAITTFVESATISEHRVTVDGDVTPISRT